jgi:DNA invertase Pin-like site-specific DNA recombinase/DNA-binding winged helix-turn-helix (wHTH) protein
MEAKPLVPAAQYVRMSTEDQQYSIANQQAAIRTYAKSHGYVVVSTYADAGKSGIEIKHRKELRRLLADVMNGRAQYKAILVYDVSRWGRFQDVDEAAHYEFLCKSAGVPVRYCAEQFDNDGSLPSSMMKALKRTMAAEYSRELGVKVSTGQRRLALLGFRVVGMAGYGLRRMMVSPDGRRRLILKDGERKAIQTDRTILVPGPKREVDCIRKMFALANLRQTPRQIAKELNVRHMHFLNGRPWNRASVYRILTNEKYAGCNTYGKTTQKLRSISRVVERNLWIINPDAFVSIVNRDVFDRVQKLIKKRGAPPEKSDAYFIQGMRRLLDREGKLTSRLLKRRRIFAHTYYKRFGSAMRAYELAGYLPPPRTVRLINTQRQIKLLRKDLYIQLKKLFPDRIRFISLPGQQLRRIVEIDGRFRVAVYLCRAINDTKVGEPGWLLRVRPLERHLPALVCTVDQSFSKLLGCYVVPPLGSTPRKYRQFRESHPWLSTGRKLGKLDDFCDIVREVVSQSEDKELYVAVDDILIGIDTWTIILGKKEIALGPVGSGILNALALNAGRVISRDRLRRSVSETLLDPHNLNSHIHTLRVKLGEEAQKRIQTVPGVGYMYVSPDKSREGGSEVASQWRNVETA